MVLVTGASGMIGRAVAARLRSAGETLRLHSRAQLDFEAASQEAYDELVRGCAAIVHCAALVHDRSAGADRYDQLNVRPTRMLARAAARQGARAFVFLSTQGVYGTGPFEAVGEDAELKPATPYAASKLRCEEELGAADIANQVILRPALVFGEGDRGNMLALIRLIDRGLYWHIAGNVAVKSLICAADLAEIVRQCLALAPGRHVFNAASAQPAGIAELANLIAEALGRRPPRSAPRALVQTAAMLLGRRDAVHSLSTTTTCSIARLESAIDPPPGIPLGEALSEEIRWARAGGYLRAAA